ncbi:MAG TPA: hypothetical protein VFI48_08475 [Hyphomicrobiaceae bacterium]|nr:hypothetical protein [Hyphomicrobiaceae bacterium]
MSNFRLPETTDARKVTREIHAFLGTLKNLLAYTESIDRIHQEEALVATARRQLDDVNAEIDKAKARAAAAEAEANSLIAVAAQKVSAAEEQATAALADLTRRHGELVASAEAEAAAAIAAIDQRRVKAEAAAVAAQRQLVDVTGLGRATTRAPARGPMLPATLVVQRHSRQCGAL